MRIILATLTGSVSGILLSFFFFSPKLVVTENWQSSRLARFEGTIQSVDFQRGELEALIVSDYDDSGVPVLFSISSSTRWTLLSRHLAFGVQTKREYSEIPPADIKMGAGATFFTEKTNPSLHLRWIIMTSI